MEMLPDSIRSAWVMPAAELDGQRVAVLQLRSALSARDAAQALAASWRSRGVRVLEARSAGAWVVSMREDEVIRTAAFQPSIGGSQGLEIRWRITRSPSSANEGPPAQALGWLPADARLLRQTTHHDPGRHAVTLVAVVPRSPVSVAQALREHARRADYPPEPLLGSAGREPGWYRGRPDGSGEALAFRRDQTEVVATVAPHESGAAVVLHWGTAR